MNKNNISSITVNKENSDCLLNELSEEITNLLGDIDNLGEIDLKKVNEFVKYIHELKLKKETISLEEYEELNKKFYLSVINKKEDIEITGTINYIFLKIELIIKFDNKPLQKHNKT